jgi:hypothetical protein
MAKSYILDHLKKSEIDDEQLEFTVELCREHDDLVRAKFQSRHSKRNKHIATVQFDDKEQKPIQGWYCTCSSGARDVGMCSHVAALLWHLGVDGAVLPSAAHPLSAVHLLAAIDDSMKFSDNEYDSDDNNRLSLGSDTAIDNKNDDSDW